jgi:hypothetical protein
MKNKKTLHMYTIDSKRLENFKINSKEKFVLALYIYYERSYRKHKTIIDLLLF